MTASARSGGTSLSPSSGMPRACVRALTRAWISLGSGEETHTTAAPATTIAASPAAVSASRRSGERRPTVVSNAPPTARGTRQMGGLAQVPWHNLVAMTIKWKVALVEDDRRLARAVATGLGEEGYTVRAVDSAGRGLDLVRQWNPDVVLLDLMLPDNEGPELFEAFRAETDAALVGISARSSVSDRIAGLKLGADDYLTKPFALEELMARVEAVIRRHRGKGGSRLVSGDVVVDLSEGRARLGERQLILTGIEFRILTALMRSSGQLVTYAQLAEGVWAVTTGPASNSLEVHISRIRQKLEVDGGSRLIQTVRGLGYRFSPE